MTTFYLIPGFRSNGEMKYNQMVEGFNAAGSGHKIKVLNYDSYHADSVYAHFMDQVDTTDDSVFVGTSLGGFWAIVLANYFASKCVVINPSLSPRDSLETYLNATGTVTEYGSGRVFDFLEEDLLSYKKYSVNLYPPIYGTLLALCRDDAVLDYKVALNFFMGKCELHLFESGGHRFDQFPEFINNIITFNNMDFGDEDFQ